MQLPALLQAQKVVSAEDGEGFSFQLGKWCGTVDRGRLPLSLWIVTVPGQHVVVGQKRQLLWALVVSSIDQRRLWAIHGCRAQGKPPCRAPVWLPLSRHIAPPTEDTHDP